MKTLFGALFLLTVLNGRAQDTAKHITFTKVEIEAHFPGGSSAWLRFLAKNLHYPDNGQGLAETVNVRFIVDAAGNVSDIEVVGDPTDSPVGKEAIRVIHLSGKWIPAIQNGHKVRSYKSVPIDIPITTI